MPMFRPKTYTNLERLLRLTPPKRTDFRRVMAAPPAVTLTTSATIASPIQWPSVTPTGSGTTSRVAGSSFSLARAGGPVINGTDYPNYVYVRYTNINYGGGTLNSNVYMASILHDGSAIEFSVKGLTGAILCKVDDEFITLTALSVPNDGGLYYYYIPFGSVKKRRIDFICYNSPFGGVYTAATDSVEPAPLRGPRCIIVGDSFTEGTGSSNVDSWPNIFAEAMGWDDVWPSGVGATGYLATNGAKVKFRDRFATDVALADPDMVMFAGGINDYSGFSTAALQAEAAALFALARASCPDAVLVALAPFWRGGASTMPLLLLAAKDAIQTEIERVGGIFLDPLELPLPLNYVPQTTTLSANINAAVTSLTVANPPVLRGTYEFANGERYRVKATAGTGPYTVTTDTAIIGAHTSGEAITQVGDCFWTGSGKVGATTGFGNCDLYVGSDGTHPSAAGHIALGQVVASLLIDELT